MQSYQTLAGRAEARIVEKKSEFIATAAPAQTERQALAVLEEVRTAHRTASHNVYAYSLRQEARQRYSDDGEPAKTAGLPVLDVITHAGIADCIVVVTRYFGGTLLGTGGLVRAYTAAAQAALKEAEILTIQLCVHLSFTLDYALFEPAKRLLEDAGARLSDPDFGENVTLIATLLQKDEVALCAKLNELFRGQTEIQTSEAFFAPF